MITLNDYLYSGYTVLRIIHNYAEDLKKSAAATRNPIDMAHANFLIQISELLEHNDFLTSQSHRVHDVYKYMARNYPALAFTFKGRIKSLIRAEEKFNGYITEYVYDYYTEHGIFPTEAEIKHRLSCFRDLIAYRIVLSVPKRHLLPGQDQEEAELNYLYDIANMLPDFLEERGFSAEQADYGGKEKSERLMPMARPYYRDYIHNVRATGYRSLHITLYDNIARCYIEVQLRTKSMDDDAEIGKANHAAYEKMQKIERMKRSTIPVGACPYFDDAFERQRLLQELDLSGLDVNMFTAADNVLINDCCGLLQGRLILPFEHLSSVQNDLMD